jgi:hypothetical protein
MELANPILSLWQQHDFRKEITIDRLPPQLRNAEDPRGIIPDLFCERMRPILQLATLFRSFRRVLPQTWRARSSIFTIDLFDGEFAQNGEGVHTYRKMLVSLSNTMCIYTGILLGSICTHAYGSYSPMMDDRIPVYLQLTADYIA